MAQLTQLDGSLQRATNLYYDSTRKLHVIEHNLKNNKIALRAARANLRRSQQALMHRLVTIYTSRNDQSTLAVLLGAQSIDDLVNRIEAMRSVSSQDVAVMNEVIGFKKAVIVHQHALVTAHRSQARLVQQRAAAKSRISSQLGREKRLGKKTLQTSGASDHVAVLRGQLFQAQHRDDVLEFCILRERPPDVLREGIMPLADDAGRGHCGTGL